jgi:SRSO17 transposase
LAQIRAALAAGVARGVVLIDASYGTNTAFRTGIGALGLTYVAAILSTVKVRAAADPHDRVSVKTPAAKANARDDDQGCESAGNGGARLSPVSFVPHNWPRRQSERRESWSEWQDLNLRPPRPERGALPTAAGRG